MWEPWKDNQNTGYQFWDISNLTMNILFQIQNKSFDLAKMSSASWVIWAGLQSFSSKILVRIAMPLTTVFSWLHCAHKTLSSNHCIFWYYVFLHNGRFSPCTRCTAVTLIISNRYIRDNNFCWSWSCVWESQEFIDFCCWAWIGYCTFCHLLAFTLSR